jgi:intraflagellar transport protein 81
MPMNKSDRFVHSFKTVEEQRQGIEGFFSTQERLEELSRTKVEQDELKGKTLDQITALIRELNERISSKKKDLDPILREVKGLRNKVDVSISDYCLLDRWILSH